MVKKKLTQEKSKPQSLDPEQIATVKAALTFALNMAETYYAFAPRHGDYSRGYNKKQERGEEIAAQLLKVL